MGISKATEKQLEELKQRSEAADGVRKAEKTHYGNMLKNAKNERKNLEKDLLRLGKLNGDYLDKINTLEEEARMKNSGNDKQMKEMKDMRKYIDKLEKQNAD